MFNLFNPAFPLSRTPVTLPLYSYIMGRMTNEYQKVVDFYRENVYTVKNTHVLARLLIEIASYTHLSPEYLVRHIRSITPNLERAYKFNSSIVDGGINREGNIYNRNVPEIWLSVAYDFSVENCYKYYKKLKPIRSVSHPFTDVTMNIPNGNYLSTQQGDAIITIDIALLALQFKAWRENEQYIKEKDMYLPLHHFIHKYVLVNYISTHVDVAIFNRLSFLLEGKTIPPARSNHSFLVVDYGERIDEVHRKLLDVFSRRKVDFVQMLKSIPSLEYGDFYISNIFPDVAPTRQIRWVLVLSKLRIVEFLLMLDNSADNSGMNINDRDLIFRELRAMRNDKSLFSYLDRETIERVDKVYNLVNRE